MSNFISTPMPVLAWTFNARLDRVVDGDTVHLIVDLGMHCWRTESFRLARINAPELSVSDPRGHSAKLYVAGWFPSTVDGSWPLIIKTRKTDSWGRYIAEIWRRSDGHNLSDDLLSSGNAVAWP